ncbi:MAG: hypothetical protein K6T51_01200 [Rubrobacteraceae bacterium]|nr:hypothetical protein [Rubrobacteraceae bacterium]
MLVVALVVIIGLIGTVVSRGEAASQEHAPQAQITGKFRLVVNGKIPRGKAISIFQRGINGQPGYEFCQTMGRNQPAPRCEKKIYSVTFLAVKGRTIHYSYRYYTDNTHYRVFKSGSFRAKQGIVITARYPKR